MMSMLPASPGPDLRMLLELFPPADAIVTEVTRVTPDEMPLPFRDLLVHEHHMTVTVESHHGQLVDVVVLDRQQDGDSYSRKILLSRQGDGKIVQCGLVQIHFQYCSPEVRAEIKSETTPLGRILINHNVLRRIEPTAFLKITPGPDMMAWFGLTTPETTYGRLAFIHCDGQPAIELLEVLAPEPINPEV